MDASEIEQMIATKNVTVGDKTWRVGDVDLKSLMILDPSEIAKRPQELVDLRISRRRGAPANHGRGR